MSVEIETSRLVLRPLAAEDFEPHAAMMAHPDVAQFLSAGGSPLPRPAEWRNFAMLLGHWRMRGFGLFSVFEKSSGCWVGRVGPVEPEGWPAIECGWGLDRAHWGKGFAGEAAIAAISWIFAERHAISRVISMIDPANRNSQRVASRIGESNTGEIFHADPAGPLEIWSVSRDDWRARFG